MLDNASIATWPSVHLAHCRSLSQRDSSVNSWRKRRLCSTLYGSPVACLVQTRSLIIGQLGWINFHMWRACSLLRSLRMKISVVSWFAAGCEVICKGHICLLALTLCSHWSASMGPGSRRLTIIRLLGALSHATAAFCMNTSWRIPS